jgi:hypothetical protein
MTEISVRPLAQADHTDWRRLWTAYLTFYETKLPEEVYAKTWERLFAPGEFEPKGFINLALLKGYKFSFESSSDHGSTHISYGMVFAEGNTRDDMIAAMKKRHTYAATDNIIADFRAPDCVRFGVSPLFLRYADIWKAMDALSEILATNAWDKPEFHKRAKVT